MKKAKKVVLVLFGAVLLLVIVGIIAIGNMVAKIQNIPAIMPDLSYFSDGDYTGEYLSSELPSLGEARGRLVLLRRYDDEAELGRNAGIALIWPNQNGYDDPARAFSDQDCSVGSLTLAVQDRYEYDEEEKWTAFCAETNGPDAVVLRFLSTKGQYDVRAPISLR